MAMPASAPLAEAATALPVTGAVLRASFLSDVVTGQIRPGERLSEESLAERWEVGRMPARETLLRLEQDGLVVRRLGSGTYLRKFNLREIVEFYDIRIGLEPLVAATASRIASDAQLEQVLQLAEAADVYDTMEPSSLDPLAHEAADRAFHDCLCTCSGLCLAPRLIELARIHLCCSAMHQRIGFLGAYTVSQPNHGPIAAALKARDPDRAARVMADHLEQAKEATLKDLRTIQARLARVRAPADSADREERPRQGAGKTRYVQDP
jgi:DNA-binding GntR family transcriptional regulator